MSDITTIELDPKVKPEVTVDTKEEVLHDPSTITVSTTCEQMKLCRTKFTNLNSKLDTVIMQSRKHLEEKAKTINGSSPKIDSSE